MYANRPSAGGGQNTADGSQRFGLLERHTHETNLAVANQGISAGGGEITAVRTSNVEKTPVDESNPQVLQLAGLTQSEFAASYVPAAGRHTTSGALHPFLQKTSSDRFTSIKKSAKQNIRLNKFSSSGIGYFPERISNQGASANQREKRVVLPPFSPTPTAGGAQVREGIEVRMRPSNLTGTEQELPPNQIDAQTEDAE